MRKSINNDQLSTSRPAKHGKQEALQTLTKIHAILAKDKILLEDIEVLNSEERTLLQHEINAEIPRRTGNSLNRFFDKIEAIVPDSLDLRHAQWEYNHTEIGRAIALFITEKGRTPTKNEIANTTGLSRQTIHKHLIEFRASSVFKIENEKLRLAGQRLLAKLFKFAIDGNIKAARLFFEMTGELGTRTTQNYYVQINNLKVDNALIQSLSREKIREIEKIILS